jgi:hypothetical protein
MILGPAAANRAGTKVIAAAAATMTAPAAAMPMTVRNGILTMARAASATTTVVPAKHTALPAVATAVAIDVSGLMPAINCCRCRVVMKRP